jgi:deoxycytidine triphosphate deaminase
MRRANGIVLPSFDPWEKWGVAELAEYNGMLWYRSEVTLTAEQAAKGGATLALGPADDMDASFVNGVPVGVTYAWGVPRLYALAPGTLKPGRNLIAVGVLDTWAEGGLLGSADQRAIRFADGTSVPLAAPSGWQWRRAPAGVGDPPHAPWEAIAGFSGIYNAMVAPIGPYGLRGAAWYQGEANAGAPDGYAGKLASMMAAWRGQFGKADLPFLIAQLSSWGPRVPKPVESGFSQIRDEQRQAVAADPHAALAVTIDLGDVVDIHPANKQDVGHRLARGAEALTYGGKASPSGPWPVEARYEGAVVRIRFTGADKGLVALSAAQPIGFELCGPGPGSCRFAAATLAGNDVLVAAGTGPPIASASAGATARSATSTTAPGFPRRRSNCRSVSPCGAPRFPRNRTPYLRGIHEYSFRPLDSRKALATGMIEPFVEAQRREGCISYGLSSYGYDARVADEFKIFTNIDSSVVDPKNFDSNSFVDRKTDVCIIPPNSFALARTVEYFRIPRDTLVICLGKSTYARCGIIVNVTPLEPEWEGHVTLEFSNTTPLPAKIYANEGACQFLFLKGDQPCETSYADRAGKYMGQRGVTLPRL